MTENSIFDATWNICVSLSNLEIELLRTRALQRLKYLNHRGIASVHSDHTFSRHEHTLGVFALVAHFEPLNKQLRAAALLHDVGHLPFSHTLEEVLDIDHHHITIDIINSVEIKALLKRYDLPIKDILSLVDGSSAPSILRNSLGFSHCDHLDSWARGAVRHGYDRNILTYILQNCRSEGGFLIFNETAARHVVDFIFHEADLHFLPGNIAAHSFLRESVRRYCQNNSITAEEIASWNDFELIFHLSRCGEVGGDIDRLLYRSHTLRAVKSKDAEYSAYPFDIVMNKIYCDQPKIEGDQGEFFNDVMRERLDAFEIRKGVYRVGIEKIE